LPESIGGWHINSIGAFTGHGRDYMMAVLTDDNPTMAYGVATIEAVARVVHRDINAGLTPAGAPLEPSFVPAELPPDSAGAAGAAPPAAREPTAARRPGPGGDPGPGARPPPGRRSPAITRTGTRPPQEGRGA